MSNDSYRPYFLDELQKDYSPEKWSEMNKTCNGNVQCLFDLAVTGIYFIDISS